MAHEVRLPRLGWSMEEGTFVGWLKADGDRIAPGEPLFELEGEKALQEIESLDAGILRVCANGPKEGDVIQVGALLAYLVEEGEALPGDLGGGVGHPTVAAMESTEPPPAAPSVRRLAREVGVPLQRVAGSGPGGRIMASDVSGAERHVEEWQGQEALRMALSSALPAANSEPSAKPSDPATQLQQDRSFSAKKATIASPRAKRIAGEIGVDWTRLTGTGANGRVRERDVRAAAATGVRPSTTGWQSIPITARRKTIAQRMVASLQQTAPVTLHCKVDATALVAARTRYKTDGSKVVPAYTDFIAKCVAKSLCQHPLLAGRWVDDRIEYPSEDGMHIGIAVDTEDGLLVPILRDVARRPLLDLSTEFRALVERARRGQLKANDMQGAVFTITSLGSFGVEAFTPFINLPESVILGVGTIRKELVVLDNGSFAPRDMLTLSLTFDHRVIDGAPAAKFLQAVVEAMQTPQG